MTSTPADGVHRDHGATGRPPRPLSAAPALILLLFGGLVLRLTIAYILFPGSGFESDLGTFTSWALTLADVGPGGFYATAGFADYPPGYLYLLWPVGLVAKALAPMAGGDAGQVAGALIKVPPILADLAVGAVLYRIVSRWRGEPTVSSARLGLLAAAAFVFNPISWYDSALWGQTDAVGALVLVVCVAALLRGNPEGAAAAAVMAGLVKPQFGLVAVPLVGAVLIRRHLLAVGSGPKGRSWLPQPIGGWLERQQGPVRVATSALIGLAVLIVLITPFSLDMPGFIRLLSETAGGYPYLSVNAFNPWALLGTDGNDPLAAAVGQTPWSSDEVPLLGPIPGVAIGTTLLVGGFLAGVGRLLARADRWSIVAVAVFLSLCFFVLPTRVHERYLFPAFAFLPILAVASGKWRWATVALAVGSLINLHGILTLPLYATENVADLPLGDLFRQSTFVLVSILLQAGVLVFVAWQLWRARAPRTDPLEQTIAETPEPLPSGLPTGASRWGEPQAEPGVVSWFAERLRVSPVRGDRSAELAGEPRGRLDRLDLLLVVLVILGAVSLRTYRVQEPYDMHFDEVYHARTAAEFLQDWRYGIPHSIYEYTHPHMAKYGIALGLIAFGNDRVTATSELGTPVQDAAIETRWSPEAAQSERDGDRLYVATGLEVRVYDLRDRGLITTLPVPASLVAVDEVGHNLYAASRAGEVWMLPTSDLDALRRRSDTDRSAPPALVPHGTVSGPLEQIAAADGILVTRAGDRLVSLGEGGESTGEAEIARAQDVVRLGPSDRLVVDPSAVDDPGAVADELASLLDDDNTPFEDLIADATQPVVVAAYLSEDITTSVREAIDDGSLPGAAIESGPIVAVAGADGVTFLDAAGLEELDRVATNLPATGLALVDRLENQTVYVAAGSTIETVPIREDGPGNGETLEMPGQVRDVRYAPDSNIVHVVGEAPDRSGWTAYVVEPHGNAVFADARLPFDPAATVMDVQPERPSDDRADLLAISAEGTVASVDVGSHAFAWRIPGVLMGAVTAAAVFLLARTLFRRRSVGILASILVLLDGMFFANARIAMNDTYVSAAILSALALFAPLYLGIWKRRLAVAVVLPVVGLLLGVALATKWVGAYAIGLVLLLILLRSALGRIIALAGMVGLTGFLGYLAVRPAEVPDPRINMTFLLLLGALTLLLAVAMVRRPVRFTLDELRFAVVAPAVLGALLVLAGFVFPEAPDRSAGSLLTPSRLLAAGVGLLLLSTIAYGATVAGARFGIGPLAPPWPAEPGEPVPAPAPVGWLRPGWAAGIPWLYALACLSAIPLAVYIASYLPWVALGPGPGFGYQIIDGWPPGHTGKTLAQLTVEMYRYHDELRAAHAASSPWWAWPLDLKPVWFHQDGFANSTTGAIHDTGNLVIFWLGIPAVAFCAWQAWTRRSLSLTFVVLAIAALWLPWARIDRATFQYHVFTSLPFTVIALAYFLAELWHGPSSRTHLLARATGAVAILGPPLLWLLRQPLCGLAGTDQVHPDGVACGALVRTVTVAQSAFVAFIVVVVGVLTILWLVRLHVGATSARPVLRLGAGSAAIELSLLGRLMAVTLVTALGAAASSLLLSPDAFVTLPIQAELLALIALLLLAAPAYLVLRSRDPRRWVIGALGAAALFFILWYPNLTGLPLPNSVAQAYLGLLPTWNYDFQFAVNQDPPGSRSLLDVGMLIIAAITLIAVALAMAAARSWRGRPSIRLRSEPLGEAG